MKPIFNGHNNCCPAPSPFVYQEPVNQPFKDNLMMLVNAKPYLLDHTKMTYGSPVNVATSIETRATMRPSTTGLLVDAVFDLSTDLTPNSVWSQYIQQVIVSDYTELERILPMIKSCITFRLYYTIKDQFNQEISNSYVDSPCQSGYINPTEIEDYYLNSFKNIFVTNIDSITYQGIYTFVIDKVDVIVDCVDIKSVLTTEGLNPYYSFTNNNSKISVFHDELNLVNPTSTAVITSVEINEAFPFQATTSTKVKISFVAYTSNMIIVPNTLGVWNALYMPDEQVIDDLKDKVTALETALTELTDRVATLEQQASFIIKYSKGLAVKTGDIVYMAIGHLYQATSTFVTDNTEEKTIIDSFNSDVISGKLIEC